MATNGVWAGAQSYQDYLFSEAEYEVEPKSEAQWVHARAAKLEDAGRERLMELLYNDDVLGPVISHLTELRLPKMDLTDGAALDMTDEQTKRFMETDAQVKAHLLALTITDLV